MSAEMLTAEAFIARWQGKDGSEKANLQSFLSDLCEVLSVPKPDPAHADNEHNAYVFERRVDIKYSNGDETRGFIDLYKRGCFVLEGKQSNTRFGSSSWDKAMQKAHKQADDYIRALPSSEGRPPFIIVVDVGRSIELYAEFSCTGGTYTPFPDSNTYRLKITDLAKPEIQARLATIWTEPQTLDPSKIAAQVTRDIAKHLAELAKSLERQYSAEQVSTFLMRCLFTMFAEDVGLLPEALFTERLEKIITKPASCAPALQHLWTLMDKGGFEPSTFDTIKRFNGGLFAHAEALPLNKEQIALLLEAARADWRFVEPAIFGTLLERALNPKERHKLGAHYTPRAYVERLVVPTVIEPLREQWATVQAAAAVLEQQGEHKKAIAEIQQFHHELCHLRILDPACGSGNFLYVTLEHLKRLEGEVLTTLQDMGYVQSTLEMEGASVNPQQFLGLEVNPRAATIAEMVLWIGYLQWHFRTHGNVAPPEPILRDFHNIECRDAVLAWESIESVLDEQGRPVTRWDGVTMKVHPVTGKDVPDESARVGVVRYVGARKAVWAKADFIVGNPPFIGAAPMRAALGDGYVEALRKVWKEVPDSSDFVMYWWHQAAETVRLGQARRFGFITTNSIRQTFNRRVIQAQLEAEKPLSLLFAIPDHPWVDSADGAAVRIAMTVGIAGEREGVLQMVITELNSDDSDAQSISFKMQKGKIFPDLTTGSSFITAQPLKANSNISYRGVSLIGDFNLTEAEAEILRTRDNTTYIRPFVNGRDIAQSPRNAFVIDLFDLSLEQVKKQLPSLYQWTLERVKPDRDAKSHTKDGAAYAKAWWQFGKPRQGMRKALQNINSYFVTPMTAKHRLFISLNHSVLPDQGLIVFAIEDQFFQGVLSSRIHIIWALSAGGRLGVGNDSRYNNSVCFETFPFPEATEAQKAKIRALAEQLDTHRKRQQAQHPDLTLTNMYNVLEKLRTGAPLNDKEKITHQQGLITLLKELHDDLDRAVFDAYGWNDLAPILVGKAGATTPLPDKPDDQTQAEEALLSRLVALNAQRAEEEAQGHIRWLRPDFQAPEAQPQQTSLPVDLLAVDDTTALAPTSKQTWPKVLQDQIKIVRDLLTTRPQTLESLAAHFKRNPQKQLQSVLEALSALGYVVQDNQRYRMS